MESLGGFGDRSLVFASFLKILRSFGAFCVVKILGHFGNFSVQTFIDNLI